MYVRLRDEQIKNVTRVYEAYQAKRAHMMEFIDKFRGRNVKLIVNQKVMVLVAQLVLYL